MKTTTLSLFAAALFAAGSLEAAAAGSVRFNPKPVSPRSIKIDAKGKIEIAKNGKALCEIAAPKNHTTQFAAAELSEYLSKIIGSKVPVVSKPSGTVPAFILGTDGAKLAGVDLVKELDRDGYIIRTVGKNIIIAGVDDLRGYPKTRADWNQRGTLFGVYEFLERFGGVRFYFPGEIGTIVPRKADWTLPGIDIMDRPDNQHRQTYCVGLKALGNGKLNFYDEKLGNQIPRLSKLRLRESTLHLPNCHGLAELGLVQRFAKTHPEYFALRENGKRHDGSVVIRGSDVDGQLCFGCEGLKNQIFEDAKAFLSGKSAKEAGILMRNGKYYWVQSRFSQPFFNIMPNDSNYPCKCEVCNPNYTKGPQVSSNFIWKFKTDIARRLQKENIPGYCTMMAYANYRLIPDVDIPSNVIVMLALTGPWNELNPNQEKFIQVLKDWNKKLGAKTYMWNYTTKCGNEIADIPGFTPKAVGTFFKKTAPYSFGSFLESETDFWLFNAMNFYVFSKVMWDVNTDVDALFAEHFKLMYGPAALQMKEFYDTLERHWLKDIMGNIRETQIGPQAVLPSQFDIWTKIYGPKEIERINKLFDSAEKAAAKDKAALKRVKFMREQMWSKILVGAKRFAKNNEDNKLWTIYAEPVTEKITVDGKLDEAAWKKASAVWMLPRKGEKVEVHTRIKMLADKEYFYIGIESDEPHTGKMLCAPRKHDELNMWEDNLVELFFASKPQDEFLYQIMLTSEGKVCDLRWMPGCSDLKWESNLEYKPGIVPGKMWVAEVKIPRKSFPELKGNQFVVNFTRGRKLDPSIKVGVPYYTWSKFGKQKAENCGTAIVGTKPESKSVVLGGDFDKKVTGRFMTVGNKRFWWTDKKMTGDKEIFRTCGQSVHVIPADGNTLRQYLPKEELKSNARYRLSFFLKLKDVDINGGVSVDVRFCCTGKYFVFYPFRQSLTGTFDWTRFSFDFDTPPNVGDKAVPYIGFNIGKKNKGSFWVDHVEMIEIPKEEKK